MFECHLCEQQTVITVNLCQDCRKKVKHVMSAYSPEIVYDFLILSPL